MNIRVTSTTMCLLADDVILFVCYFIVVAVCIGNVILIQRSNVFGDSALIIQEWSKPLPTLTLLKSKSIPFLSPQASFAFYATIPLESVLRVRVRVSPYSDSFRPPLLLRLHKRWVGGYADIIPTELLTSRKVIFRIPQSAQEIYISRYTDTTVAPIGAENHVMKARFLRMHPLVLGSVSSAATVTQADIQSETKVNFDICCIRIYFLCCLLFICAAASS